MKRSVASFLQAITVFIGVAVFAFMLWEPHIEGRNAHATTFEIYFNDPFLAYVYLGSTPFFVALYRAFQLFGHAGQNGAFSQVTLDGLRVIRHCALVLIAFVAVGVVIIFLTGDKDDRPVGFVIGFLIAFASGVVASKATILAGKLRTALSQPKG